MLKIEIEYEFKVDGDRGNNRTATFTVEYPGAELSQIAEVLGVDIASVRTLLLNSHPTVRIVD